MLLYSVMIDYCPIKRMLWMRIHKRNQYKIISHLLQYWRILAHLLFSNCCQEYQSQYFVFEHKAMIASHQNSACGWSHHNNYSFASVCCWYSVYSFDNFYMEFADSVVKTQKPCMYDSVECIHDLMCISWKWKFPHTCTNSQKR